MSENIDDDVVSENVTSTVGEQLKAQREKLSMSLDDVADRTRVTMRHLEAIENSQFHKLPGKTYVMGFAKAYARSVELNDADIAKQLREELALTQEEQTHRAVTSYEPAASSSIAPKTLAWTAAIIGAIALSAFVIWRAAQFDINSDPTPEQSVAQAPNDPAPQPEAPAPIATGKVIMTATDEVWFEIYDADRNTINENVFQAGDTYEIPADAKGPMIVTGKPDALKFTVGDTEIKPLGDGNRTIKDVGISANALISYQNSDAVEAQPITQ